MNKVRMWLREAGAWAIILIFLLAFALVIIGPYLIAAHFIHKYW